MNDDADYRLEDSFGYWLNRLARAMREAVDRDFARHGVNVAHWAVLAAAEPEEGARVLELSRRVGVDPAGVTRLIDKLEAAGLLARAADPADRRAQRVRLTPAGRELLPKLKEISIRHNRWWMDQLGEGTAVDLVRGARAALERDGPGGG